MYRQFRRKHFGNRNPNRGKRVKSFDPTDLIDNIPSTIPTEREHVVSHKFSDFNLSNILKQNLQNGRYLTPTPIQDRAIEPILEGRDLVGIANTGTGKTAAFLIPLLEKVINNKNEKVLILAPTRELASQIKSEFIYLSRGMGIYAALCIGGENIKWQIQELERNPNFIIATPGRILDLIHSRKVNLQNFSSVVLDEADRMVDIGFVKDIKYIISLLPRTRQSLFFSATIDNDVQQILRSFVYDPITISVKTSETAKNVTQKIVRIPDVSRKVDQLHELLISESFVKVLVFGRTKHGVQKLSDELDKRGFKVGAIHGNKRQSQRARVLELFKKDHIKILVATDVASRGLDIPNVSHIINYDLPESKEAYIHRIGRTGRADKTGIALTFIEQNR